MSAANPPDDFDAGIARDGIVFRALHTPTEMAEVVALQIETWGPADCTPANQLVISVKSGGHVLGAFDGTTLVAFLYGFPAVVPGAAPWLASHMLATRPSHASRGVGRTLKWLQRDWALARGFRRITWTFDPLEARNCHLNLNVLGATAPEYIVDCYGHMDDKLNRGLPSDRFMAHWDLDGERVKTAREGQARWRDGERVRIPTDFQALKRTDIDEALRVREAVREQILPLIARGLAASALDRTTGEVVFTPRGGAAEL